MLEGTFILLNIPIEHNFNKPPSSSGQLCGFELERDCRDHLMDILKTLGQLENSTDNSTGRFIRSVLDLQQKSWGRNEEVGKFASR